MLKRNALLRVSLAPRALPIPLCRKLPREPSGEVLEGCYWEKGKVGRRREEETRG